MFKIPVYKYIVTSKFIEPASLPSYKGSTLRGAFGLTFRSIVCVNKKVFSCSECFLSCKCSYKYIFEPNITKEDKNMNIPAPFILEPPYDNKRDYKKGDSFAFVCIIIGKAVEYFPYFVLTFQEIGKRGIGIKNHRGRFELQKIKSANRIIYEKGTDTLKDFRKSLRLNSHCSSYDSITVNFISPVRIKIEGRLMNTLPFYLFFKTLIRRITILGKYYCDNQDNFEDIHLLEKSQSIITASSSLQWYDWQRFSYRQKTMMKLGGLIGNITYKGDLKEFLAYIKLGEIIHIGKNCSFGLGKYIIIR